MDAFQLNSGSQQFSSLDLSINTFKLEHEGQMYIQWSEMRIVPAAKSLFLGPGIMI